MAKNILEKTTIIDDGRKRSFVVEGGLHYIRGNSTPYFSLTCWCGGNSPGSWGGANHEAILQHFPKYADLAALHLSDIDGQPMHAAANGWYWLEGALGGCGSKYHGGSGISAKSPEECRKIFQRHLRLSDDRLAEVLEDVQGIYDNAREMGMAKSEQRKVLAQWVHQLCQGERDRWKAEAKACIAAHDLSIYGDPWSE